MNELEVFSFFQNEVKMIEKENKSLHHFIRILIALDLNRWKAAVFPMHFSSSEIFFQFKTKMFRAIYVSPKKKQSFIISIDYKSEYFLLFCTFFVYMNTAILGTVKSFAGP